MRLATLVAGFCAFFLVFGENYSIENDPNLYTVTNTIESDTVVFDSTQCATACIGYHVKYDTVPTIHSLEKAGVSFFLAILCRILFMMVEMTLLKQVRRERVASATRI